MPTKINKTPDLRIQAKYGWHIRRGRCLASTKSSRRRCRRHRHIGETGEAAAVIMRAVRRRRAAPRALMLRFVPVRTSGQELIRWMGM
jgi:hypothetical protein